MDSLTLIAFVLSPFILGNIVGRLILNYHKTHIVKCALRNAIEYHYGEFDKDLYNFIWSYISKDEDILRYIRESKFPIQKCSRYILYFFDKYKKDYRSDSSEN